jgi:hypothetical protein
MLRSSAKNQNKPPQRHNLQKAVPFFWHKKVDFTFSLCYLRAMSEREPNFIGAFDKAVTQKLETWKVSPNEVNCAEINALIKLAEDAGIGLKVRLSKDVLNYDGSERTNNGSKLSQFPDNVFDFYAKRTRNSIVFDLPSTKRIQFKNFSPMVYESLLGILIRDMGEVFVGQFFPKDVKSITLLKD